MPLYEALLCLALTEVLALALWRVWEGLTRDMMEQNTLTELTGTVEEIIFSNTENGYTVLRLEQDGGETVTVTGCLPFAAPGEKLLVGGSWVNRAGYGQQFQAEYADRQMPSGAEAVYEYLASGVVKGIGPATASVLVSAFGDRALEVIEREPEKLTELKGITRKRAEMMCQSLRRQLGIRHLMEFLNAYGLRPQYALRLYQKRGDRALAEVQENPYLLCGTDIGAPFSEADRLAQALGMEPDSPERLCAALLFELRYNTRNGHVFIPREKLIVATAQLLDMEMHPLEEGLDILADSGEVVQEPICGCQACYLSRLYEAETYCAARLSALGAGRFASDGQFDALLSELEKTQHIRYAPMQRKTLAIAARHQAMVITGGPGTGKSTTVRALLALLDKMGVKRVLLAAPTGRAAKRLSEVTGREASTIHRLLEAGYKDGSSELTFQRDESQPLKCGAVIVDECSMLDILLTRALLAALRPDCRLILVGDADQLPSVGPGNVFRDILRSGAVPVVRLTEIFRQKEDSRIVSYAHRINGGEHPNFSENKGDFFFLRRLNQNAALELAVQLCAERLPKNMGIPPEEIQVLTPTRRGVAGVESLNRALQAALNPPAEGKAERRQGERVFRVGDRVMQIRNNYDIVWTDARKKSAGTGAFNGDIGYIVAIDPGQESLTVDFDGRLTLYGFDMLSELEHAWAMTVHKSQGSEYRAVVLCICGGPPQLLYRGVLYTAVTRARELLIAVGDDRLLHQMVDNHRQTRRYSALRARLAALTEAQAAQTARAAQAGQKARSGAATAAPEV